MQKESDQIGGATPEDPMNHRRQPPAKPDNRNRQQQQQPHPQEPQQCPRCDSFNTKFCYYNNYSLSQPRFFCKACRRYWTRGGTLRNVPVGGGCRKGKRTKPSPSPSSSSAAAGVASSHSQSLLLPPLPQNIAATASATPNLLGLSPSPALRAAKPPPPERPLLQPMLASSYYVGGAPTGGFMPPFATIQSFSHPPQHAASYHNQVLNNLEILNGLENFPSSSSFGNHFRHNQQDQEQQGEGLGEKIPESSVFLPPDHQGTLSMNVHPNRSLISAVQDWDQEGFNFVGSSNPTIAAGAAPGFNGGGFWNGNPSTTASSSSLNPSGATHWPPPPPPHLP